MEFVAELLGYSFMQSALTAILLASVACGIVGTLVVCNRLTFLAGGAAHAAYGGIGLAFHFGLPVLPCTVLFTLAASLGMGSVSLKREEKGKPDSSTDAAVGVLWAAGMAFGIILIQLTPGYAGELTAFLFGSLLSVPASDLWVMAGFDVLLLGVLFTCGRGLFLVSADPDFARSRGIPAHALTLLIIGLTAVAVVLLIRVAGLILVLALLTIPPLVARRVCKTFYGTMFGACIASLAFCLAGLALSWTFNLSPGAVIVGIATITYFGLSLPVRKCARVAAIRALTLGFTTQPMIADASPQQIASDAFRPQDKASAVNVAARYISTSVTPTGSMPNSVRRRITTMRVGTAPADTQAVTQNVALAADRNMASISRVAAQSKNSADSRLALASANLPAGGRAGDLTKATNDSRTGVKPEADASNREKASLGRSTPDKALALRAPERDIDANDVAPLGNRASTYESARDPGTKAELASKGISSGFAKQRRTHVHKGIDIPAEPGSPVLAFKGGEVLHAGRYYAYGTLVRIRQSDGKEAFYGHLQKAGVTEGDFVKAGQQIGTVGRTGRATGYHLHFELREDDAPVDPTPYLVHACEIVPGARLCPTPQVELQAERNAAKREGRASSQDGVAELRTPGRSSSGGGATPGSFPSRFSWTDAPGATALP
jgi:zinc transport system permease protein